MPILTATRGGNVPVDFEAGRFILTFKSMSGTDASGQPIAGQFGPQWQWTWGWRTAIDNSELHDERGFVQDYLERTSQKMGKGGAQTAEARLRVEALLGRELEEGEQIDTDDLEGRSIIAMMDVGETGYVGILKGSIKPNKKAEKADKDD